MSDSVEIQFPIQMSDAAANKVKSLITEEENPDLKLRVYITGGGCSGFQYGFTFDEAINDGDTVIEKNGVIMVIDSMSLQYLVGGVVDYIEGLEGSRFLVNNPNATSTCGCGSSFSIQSEGRGSTGLSKSVTDAHFPFCAPFPDFTAGRLTFGPFHFCRAAALVIVLPFFCHVTKLSYSFARLRSVHNEENDHD